ncbi:hypothetical protein GCM10011529_01620 [Polymorphobacter glacialis]|uniref:Lipoprotein n=1 Tax=Sandarakinorhabdus glacialis TaxID=1614636 RepID=A0A917E3D6_9SPHN|nr:hypothetical protein [Polymorphobacter glacialis]GGD99184.1 hypothetical protein GCM10011529_01620 [Polymorphobacter glacialis]
MSNPRITAVLFLASAAVLAGCESNPLQVQRSPCPAVAIPTYTGDTTLFTGSGQDAANIDVVATMTNVREACSETTESFTSDITYDVVARRTSAAGARTVTLPVFATVVQGGNLLVSKQVGAVNVDFADGQARAIGKGGARGTVSRAVATLPPETLAKINRKRKAGDLDAAVDPLSDPEVRAAIRAASFEVLIGFQLGESALAYNVTK